jgi:hypothetical protein
MRTFHFHFFLLSGILTAITACAPLHKPRTNTRSNPCTRFETGGTAWTPHQVRGALACLAHQAQPHPADIASPSALEQLPEESFRESAHWLNAHLQPELRENFLARLETLPRELGALLESPAARAALTDDRFPSRYSHFLDLLAWVAERPGPSLQMLAALDRFPLSARAQATFTELLLKLRALPSQEQSAALTALSDIARVLESEPQAFAFATRFADGFRCSAAAGTALWHVRPPLARMTRQLAEPDLNAEVFVTHLTESYALWQDLCGARGVQPSPAEMSDAAQVLHRSFATFTQLARVATRNGIEETLSRMLAETPALLGELRAFGGMSFLMDSLATGAGAQALRSLPASAEGVLDTWAIARPGLAPALVALLGDGRAPPLVQSFRSLEFSTPLLAEWMGLVHALGDEALPSLGRYIREGRLAEVVELLSGQAPSPLPSPPAPSGDPLPSVSVPVISSTLPFGGKNPALCVAQAPALRRACLLAALPGSAPWPLLSDLGQRQEGLAGSHEQLENLAHLATRFAATPSAAADVQTNLIKLLEALGELRLPTALWRQAGSEFAARTRTLPPASLQRVFARLRFPSLDRRRQDPAVPFASLPRVSVTEGAWLRTVFPARMAEFLTTQPADLLALREATRTQHELPLRSREAGGREKTFKLDGLEILDALLWELQIESVPLLDPDLINSRVIRGLVAVKDEAGAKAWLQEMGGQLGFARGAVGFFGHWLPDADQRIDNAQRLFNAVRTALPPRTLVAVARLVSTNLPNQDEGVSRTEVFALQHRIGLFRTLSAWLRADDALSVNLTPPDQPTLERAFRTFFRQLSDEDLLRLGLVNLHSRGEVTAQGFRVLLAAVHEHTEPALSDAISALLATIAPSFFRVAVPRLDNPACALADLQRVFDAMNRLTNPLTRALESPDTKESLAVVMSLMQNAPLAPPAAAAPLWLGELATPEGRRGWIAWLRAGGLQALTEWAVLLELESN